MRRRAILALVAAAAPVVVGCGDDRQRSSRIGGDTYAIYASLPAHGTGARAARDAEAGMRLALRDAGNRAGERRVRFVRMSSTRPGDELWDPGTVEANAKRAADDPGTAVYIGEFNLGASAVSLPVTNREGILQVSPADGLTSLGRMLPGEATDGSQRYYPEGTLTFVRFVPPDLDAARRAAAAIAELGTRRLVVLEGDGIASRELERMVLTQLRGDGPPVEITRVSVRGDKADDVAPIVEQTLAASPHAVLYAGPAGARAASVLAALAGRLDGVPVIGGPPLAEGDVVGAVPEGTCAWTGVPEESQLPARGRRLLERIRRESGRDVGVHGLLGHAAMRLALNAIERGGPDRRRIVQAGRSNVDRDEVAVGYGLGNRAHVEPVAVDCVEVGEG